MAANAKSSKRLFKIHDPKVARDRVRFWYWLVSSVEGLSPSQLENRFNRAGKGKPSRPRANGSRIWAKYKAGTANPMSGSSAANPDEKHVVDLVAQDPRYASVHSKEWLQSEIWRLMDEDNVMSPTELWETFKKLPDEYWDALVDGSKFHKRRKKFWRLPSADKQEALIEHIRADLSMGKLEAPLMAIYALVQDSLMRQDQKQYEFWRAEAARVEADRSIRWIGQLSDGTPRGVARKAKF